MRQYLHGVNHGVQKQLLLAVAALLGTALLASSPVGAAGQAGGGGCPPSFDYGPLSFSDAVNLRRISDAFGEDVYTIGEFEALFRVIDHNGDGRLCFKDVGALNGEASYWKFFYNAIDNNATRPGSDMD